MHDTYGKQLVTCTPYAFPGANFWKSQRKIRALKEEHVENGIAVALLHGGTLQQIAYRVLVKHLLFFMEVHSAEPKGKNPSLLFSYSTPAWTKTSRTSSPRALHGK